MAETGRARSILALSGRVVNEGVSFVVFSFLDVLDFVLCFLFKLADFLVEAEWKPCYCSSPKEAKILVSGQAGESKVICLTSSRKMQLEDVSDTLYRRPSSVSQVKTWKLDATVAKKRTRTRTTSTFTVNSTVVEMLRGKIGAHPVPRWSDCDCKTCTSWTSSSSKGTLFVKVDAPRVSEAKPTEDVLFIHGFISSSRFWTETVFPNFSASAKSKYRMFAVDLLGFGRSPKPTDSLYTLREHVEMIERSVLDPFKVKSFHIVAHSLGCILALALAVKHPSCVKSLTLLAPPYFPVPKGEEATQYVLKRVAPRRVWPPIALGASIACWYEHISRTACLFICKNHRLWESLTKLLAGNRYGTFLVEGFFCHTHNAAWHTVHNIICGTAGKLDGYLDAVRESVKCEVTVFHGRGDELLPVECSYNVQRRIPRAKVRVIEDKDHITIVLGRREAFARELEEIWRASSGN